MSDLEHINPTACCKLSPTMFLERVLLLCMQRAEAIRKTIRHYTLGGDLSIIAPTKELKTEEYLKSFLFKRRLYSLFQILKEF